MIDLELIKEKAKFYAKELWELDFDLPIFINNRYKNRMGCTNYKRGKENQEIPINIMLARYLFDGKYKELTIDDTLIHELCHWYCSINGKNSNDGSKDFEEELHKIGASTSGTSFMVGTVYLGKCEKCGKIVIEKDRKSILEKYLHTNRFTTICCHSQITYNGTKEYEDTNEVSNRVKELNQKFKEYVLKKSA